MNSKHRKTLTDIFAVPTNGALEWVRIESLLVAIGCEVIEGKGSAVAFHKNDRVFRTHRPHTGKESLRYRVLGVRDFLSELGGLP